MEPIAINLLYRPLMPEDDISRIDLFRDADYHRNHSEPFRSVLDELIQLSVRLIELLPDPSLSPDERLERLARVVPNSQLITAHRRTARRKLADLRRRLDELVSDDQLAYTEKLEWLIARVHEFVPGNGRLIEKLETIGDYRDTDIGVSPRHWQ